MSGHLKLPVILIYMKLYLKEPFTSAGFMRAYEELFLKPLRLINNLVPVNEKQLA